ncbi:MAG: tRNA (adenosine(37)-N6)-dimethylallyltransferase MiaA [Candidatus Polarisedimenticolia bacterium]
MSASSLLVVLGPTATGKSELAVRLARRLGGRVINADSMQVYRGLDAGTCKPPAEARREIPHALVDVADPAEPFSAGTFARLATRAIEECRQAGAVPIVSGGTGLYLKALLHGLAPAPPRDDAVRETLYAQARATSTADLHGELARIDPDTAGRLGPNDLQRIVRALEVARITGRPLSAHIREQAFDPGRVPAVRIGLTMDRAALNRRIDMRVDGIFEAGIVQEVRELLASGVPEGANALKALGYREVVRHLGGVYDLARTVDLVKRNTRRYARRQIQWFRREPEVHWLDVGEGLEPAEREALALWEESSRDR